MSESHTPSDTPDPQAQPPSLADDGGGDPPQTGDPQAPSPPSEVPALRANSSLSLSQCRALENLMTGHSMSAAARGAGVGRTTLYRWLKEDPAFRAAHNAWQKDTVAAARSSILALTEPAIRAVAAALESGDAKTGLKLLSSLGMLTPPTPGSTEPADVQKELHIERKRKETDLFLADLEAGFPKYPPPLPPPFPRRRRLRYSEDPDSPRRRHLR